MQAWMSQENPRFRRSFLRAPALLFLSYGICVPYSLLLLHALQVSVVAKLKVPCWHEGGVAYFLLWTELCPLQVFMLKPELLMWLCLETGLLEITKVIRMESLPNGINDLLRSGREREVSLSPHTNTDGSPREDTAKWQPEETPH